MAYIDKYGVEYSDNKKTLVRCPKGFRGAYNILDGVTEINSRAFEGCTGLTSIEIPNSVTEIGCGSFRGCISLPVKNGIRYADCYLIEVVNRNQPSYLIKNGTRFIGCYAFKECTKLTTIEIPNSIIMIGMGAFFDCTSLTTITIPNSITEIGKYAFQGCTNLTCITMPDSVTKIGCSAFKGCVGLSFIKIPNSVKEIESDIFGGSVFEDCIGQIIDDCIYMDTFLIGVTDKSKSSYVMKDNTRFIGSSAFHGCNNLTSIKIPNSVTEIGYSAFKGCNSLTSIDVPNSVIKIEPRAFLGCTGLTSIIIPNSVTMLEHYTFSGCTGLTSIEIPDSVTKIEDGVFEGCTGLTSIKIPNSVKEIGRNVFRGCSSLTTIDIPYSLKYISDTFEGSTGLPIEDGIRYAGTFLVEVIDKSQSSYIIKDGTRIIGFSAFKESKNLSTIEIPNSVQMIYPGAFESCTGLTSIEIPDSVTEIYSKTFKGCTGLTSITIPNSVTKIHSNAFEGCVRLTSIDIPNSVTEIRSETFKGCTGLTSIEIPDSVTKIEYRVFEGCTGLTSITIPDLVTEIGWYAFKGCTGLTSIEIPDSVTKIGNGVFEGCTSFPIENGLQYAHIYLTEAIERDLTSYFIKKETKFIGSYAFNNCTDLTSIIIPNSVTEIGESAFNGCTSLISITIPNSVTQIGQSAFQGCTGLTSIEIPNSVKKIGNFAFEGCAGLTSITIPNSITEIGYSAFKDCIRLKSVEIPNSVFTIHFRAFSGCKGITHIVIPQSVHTIDGDVFANISAELRIGVDRNNIHYCSKDGSLFTKDLKHLLHHFALQKDTYTTPNEVEIIDSTAFEWSPVKKVVLSEGVKDIQSDAFWASNNEEIYIPSTITTIGKTAFKHSKINKLHINHENPEQIDVADNAFEECAEHCTLYVPVGTGYAYRHHPVFGKFKEVIIEEAPIEDYTILLSMAKGFELGIGVSIDIDQSILLYAQAVEKGCVEAAFHLGELYENGEVVAQDLQKAADWYEKAANLGNPSAANRKQTCLDKIQEENDKMRAYQQEMIASKRDVQTIQDSPIHATYLFFDTETTGVPSNYKAPCTDTDNWPRMVQLAWIATDEHGNELKRGTHIIKPEGFSIPTNAAAVHGITTDRANREGEDLSSVLQEFYSLLVNAQTIVGHNIDFDIHIVGAEMYRKSMDYSQITSKHHICTMQSTINFCAIPSYSRYGGYKYPKLQELYTKLFGHLFDDAHDAMADITATKDCFFELVKRGIINP